MNVIKITCILLIMLYNTVLTSALAANKPNVLFITIDDLRPELGVYGAKLAKTPNIDALAKQGIMFTQAHAQQAICGPSRASFLTGGRPDTIAVTHNYQKLRDKFPNIVTLPQYFRNNGYETAYFGKIFHQTDLDEERSWSWKTGKNTLPKGIKPPPNYASATNNTLQKENRKAMIKKYGEQAKYGLGRGPATEGEDVPDNQYIDGFNTDLAITTMKKMRATSNKPLFLALGLKKPHLPWIAPKKYFDLYSPDDIELTQQTTPPIDSSPVGLHASFELRTFSDMPNTAAFTTAQEIKLKHAYLACVSYVDAQVGRMVKALKDEGILDNTIIVLLSDHGWHLGEMGIWGKATNFDIATRVPLIFWTPELAKSNQMNKTNSPKKSNALVELVDVYPTLADLAGLPVSKTLAVQLEGQSLTPLFESPNRAWKSAVFSQFPTPALREWGAFPLRRGMRETYFGTLIERVEQRIKQKHTTAWDRQLFEQNLMGYSMRTQQYRLIVWQDITHPEKAPLYVELYDHEVDPAETINIAKHQPALVKKLQQQLALGPNGNKAIMY